MKAQFKYAFLAGLHTRGPVFGVIMIMNLVFIALGSAGWLPFAASVTAVSLGGVAIAVMMAFNIISDVSVAGHMFSAPSAYIFALSPSPRGKTLFAGVVTMALMDIATMAAVIASEAALSFNLAGEPAGLLVREAFSQNAAAFAQGLYLTLLLIAGYLLTLMIIMACVAAGKSLFYGKRGGKLLTALFAIGIIYVVSASPLLLAPLGGVSRFGPFFTITLGQAGLVCYVVLLLVQAAALFVLTARLLERKINI